MRRIVLFVVLCAFTALAPVICSALATDQTSPTGKPQPGGVDLGPAQPAKPAANTPAAGDASVPVEAENPDATEVINGMRVLDDPKAFAATELALKGLDDHTAYKKAAPDLFAAVHDTLTADNQTGWPHALEELALGKQGPHLLIHYLKVNDTDTSKTDALRIETSRWYIWRENIGFEEYSGTRLYGIRKLHLLSVVGPFRDAKARLVYQKLEYRALVKKQTPANVQNFLGLLKLLGVPGAIAEATPPPAYLVGFGSLDNVPPVSDITPGAYKRSQDDPTKLQRVGSQVALTNEGFHRWDISIGFPVNRVTALTFDQKDNTVQTREVDKSAILALADLFFRPVDLRDPGSSWAPGVAVGAGLKGKVRDHLFAGFTSNLPPIPGFPSTRGGWYQAFRPYIGVNFINRSVPVTNPPPGSPVSKQRTVRKVSFGVNIPVMSTLQRLLDSNKSPEAAPAGDAKKKPSSGTAAKTP